MFKSMILKVMFILPIMFFWQLYLVSFLDHSEFLAFMRNSFENPYVFVNMFSVIALPTMTMAILFDAHKLILILWSQYKIETTRTTLKIVTVN